jgi:hypothetical protein
LHVGNKEDEPIKATQAAPRGRKRRLGGIGTLTRRWSGFSRAAALPIMTVAETA